MSKQKSPFRKGLQEASYLLLAAIIIAGGFNLFASTNIPWIRELPTLEEAPDSLLFGAASTPGDNDTFQKDAPAEIIDTAMGTGMKVEPDEKEQQSTIDTARPSKKETPATQPSSDVPRTTPANPQSGTNQATDGPKGIGTQKAKQIFDTKNATFIDARRPDQFAEGHIPGAMNVYAYDFQKYIPDLIPLPKDKLVVVYCDGGLCELSHELAEELITFGFQRVVVYLGGVEEWTGQNYPMTGGK